MVGGGWANRTTIWENIVPYDRETGKVVEGQGNTLVDR